MYETVLFPYYEAVSRLCPSSQLKAAVLRLGEKYSQSRGGELVGLSEHVAYVICRMAATFAADRRALQHMKKILPDFAPKSVLDIGCGPGGALFAAIEAFPSIEKGTGLDRSSDFARLFNILFSQSFAPKIPCTITQSNLSQNILWKDSVDLAIASYSLGELSETSRASWIKEAKEKSRVLLIVEPGTPAGYTRLMECRKLAIQLNGTIIAPCTHMQACPHEGTKRWCHESVRLFRTALHRRMKEGSLGYEDEKFCYLAVVFDRSILLTIPPYRIVHVPQHRHGHSNFVVCSKEGKIEKIIFSKKHQGSYREAREAEWGDSVNEIP